MAGARNFTASKSQKAEKSNSPPFHIVFGTIGNLEACRYGFANAVPMNYWTIETIEMIEMIEKSPNRQITVSLNNKSGTAEKIHPVVMNLEFKVYINDFVKMIEKKNIPTSIIISNALSINIFCRL